VVVWLRTLVYQKPRWVKEKMEELQAKQFKDANIDFSIEQNIRMFEKYCELAQICPDCKLLMSPQAQRCMDCHSRKRSAGDTVFVTRDHDFKKKMREKLKELAKEQGVSLRTLGFKE
jgi:hypothetical protein